MPISDEEVVEQTRRWLSSFIIKLNICPFAKREFERGSVKIQVAKDLKITEALEDLLFELIYLDKHPTTETTLLIFPGLFDDFGDYLDFVDDAELVIREQDYEGVYQLATFHPDYCFADTEINDPSNYTNRSPYPMIHLLREEGLEKAIAHYGDTAKIPEQNIAAMKKMGLEKIKAILAAIKI